MCVERFPSILQVLNQRHSLFQRELLYFKRKVRTKEESQQMRKVNIVLRLNLDNILLLHLWMLMKRRRVLDYIQVKKLSLLMVLQFLTLTSVNLSSLLVAKLSVLNKKIKSARLSKFNLSVRIRYFKLNKLMKRVSISLKRFFQESIN